MRFELQGDLKAFSEHAGKRVAKVQGNPSDHTDVELIELHQKILPLQVRYIAIRDAMIQLERDLHMIMSQHEPFTNIPAAAMMLQPS